MIDLLQNTEYAEQDFDTMRNNCLGCERCKLHTTRTQVVFGIGPVPCPLMVIGEGPGEQEDLQGVPFVGRAGQLLTKIFESVGINRETDLYITNTVKCRPPGNRNPEPDEISACRDYLVRQIQIVQPKVLLLLGSPAYKTILENPLPISKARGQWFNIEIPYMEEELNVMPIFHPSYLLRNASKEKGSPKWLTWQDMKQVKKVLDYYAVLETTT